VDEGDEGDGTRVAMDTVGESIRLTWLPRAWGARRGLVTNGTIFGAKLVGRGRKSQNICSALNASPLHFLYQLERRPFINRFAVGFVIGASNLPVPGWLSGLIFGVLLSLPDAIITKA
jgi:hypothetical protein